jgi:hypothetical protein
MMCHRCATVDVDIMASEVESVIADAARGWRWVLDRRYATPAWRLAWLLHGMPTPLPGDLYREVLAAFEAAFGVAELIRGLRHAASMPAPHESGVDPERFASLAASYARRAA